MSNLLAALGCAQLSRLDAMIARRRYIRQRYRRLFWRIPGVEIFGGQDDSEDNAWLTAVVVDVDVAGWTPTALADWLAECGIETRALWKPMHLQPVFAREWAVLSGAAERLFRSGLALPSGSVLGEHDLVRIEEAIRQFLERTTPRSAA